jgi:hypothetical protein
MKSSEADLQFPVLGFTPDRENWGFPDLDRLTKCGPGTLKENKQVGMELIDAKRRRWRVLSIRRTGRAGSLLSYLWIFGPPQFRIEQELEELAPISLADARQRMRESVETYSVDYMDGDDDTEYRSLLEKLGAAGSISEIYELFQPDTFEPY